MPRRLSRNQAQKAPIMYCAPWVKLMMLSSPKMTARPRLNMALNAPLISPSRSWPNSACGGIPSSSNSTLHPCAAIGSALLDQRASALAERPKGLLGRDRRELLVVVVLILGIARRLHLEEVHVAHDTAVLAQLAVLGHEVVDRDLAHLGDHRLALVGLGRLDRL